VFRFAIWKVRLGLTARFRAYGASMEPVIPSCSRVMIEPVDVERLELGDIVAVKLGGDTMLHLVKASTGINTSWRSQAPAVHRTDGRASNASARSAPRSRERTIVGSQRKRRRRLARYA
jgi:hypothetical protein